VWLVWPAFQASQNVADNAMDIKTFGELPVRYEGRIKPMDTVARTTLKALSNRETFTDSSGKRHPAILWFLDVISNAPKAVEHRVVRIDNSEVLALFGLSPRPTMRYALSELAPKISQFESEVAKIVQKSRNGETLSTYERKISELDSRLRAFLRVKRGFWLPELPEQIPSLDQIQARDPQAMQTLRILAAIKDELPRHDELEGLGVPQTVPRVVEGRVEWVPYASLYAEGYVAKLRQVMLQPPQPSSMNPGAEAMAGMLRAYAEGRAADFNRYLRSYQDYLAHTAPEAYDAHKVAFEAFYNRFAPFFHAQWAYFAALVLSLLGFLGWSRMFNRAAFWLIVVTLLVHCFALAARIYISGRPPVTTLYSSAIFIGWAAVIAGLCIEILFRLGIGNLLAGLTGFTTLLIASFLATGDTMPVLQAVLDTQFWLSTHVVFITLGYSATFAAGALAIIYLLDRAWLRRWDEETARSVVRMIYGTVCFALLFSFVGTVWGGLWADDSWGRFWGWDPKENGALMIVLWNAILLHARWGGMVRDRGLALLAVGGNIITSWSWFGVNELGAGLHSYGFTEGVLAALGLFVLSQLAIILVGVFVPASRFQPVVVPTGPGRPAVTKR
jgi:ABC-type transport system involved in cytochrome c biogenesis permease subunit